MSSSTPFTTGNLIAKYNTTVPNATPIGANIYVDNVDRKLKIKQIGTTFDVGTIFNSIVNPTKFDDNDSPNGKFNVNSKWLNTVTGVEFVCVDNSSDNAVWKQTTQILKKNDVELVTFGLVELPNYTVSGDSDNRTLTGIAPFAPLVIDGIPVAVNDRILVTNAVAVVGGNINSGIYTVVNVGSGSVSWVLTRSVDANSSTKLPKGSFTLVNKGLSHTGKSFQLTTLLGSAQTWSQLNSGGGGISDVPAYPKSAVRVKTTTNLSVMQNGDVGVGKTLTNSLGFGTLSIDGITMNNRDRILVTNLTFNSDISAADYGIYEVTNLGDNTSIAWVLTRAEDADGSPNGKVDTGIYTVVTEGTVNSNTMWYLNSNSFNNQVDTAAQNWSQVSFGGISDVPAGPKNAVIAVTTSNLDVDSKLGSGIGKQLIGPNNTILPNNVFGNVNNITVNSRVLITNLINGGTINSDKGIYTVTSLGLVSGSGWILTRATDADGSSNGKIDTGSYVTIINKSFPNISNGQIFIMDTPNFNNQVDVISVNQNWTLSDFNGVIYTNQIQNRLGTNIDISIPGTTSNNIILNPGTGTGKVLTNKIGNIIGQHLEISTTGLAKSITLNTIDGPINLTAGGITDNINLIHGINGGKVLTNKIGNFIGQPLALSTNGTGDLLTLTTVNADINLTASGDTTNIKLIPGGEFGGVIGKVLTNKIGNLSGQNLEISTNSSNSISTTTIDGNINLTAGGFSSDIVLTSGKDINTNTVQGDINLNAGSNINTTDPRNINIINNAGADNSNINLTNNSTALNSNINISATGNNNINLIPGSTGKVLTNKIENITGQNLSLNTTGTNTISATTTSGNVNLTAGGTGNVITSTTDGNINLTAEGNNGSININTNANNNNIILNPHGTGSVNVSSKKITGLANPTNSNDAVNKQYADALAQGFGPKNAVLYKTTAADLDVSGSMNIVSYTILNSVDSGYEIGYPGKGAKITNAGFPLAALSIDGNLVSSGTRILVAHSSNINGTIDGFINKNLGRLYGIYTVTNSGSISQQWVLTRADDCDGYPLAGEYKTGNYTFVYTGATFARQGFSVFTVGSIGFDINGNTIDGTSFGNVFWGLTSAAGGNSGIFGDITVGVKTINTISNTNNGNIIIESLANTGNSNIQIKHLNSGSLDLISENASPTVAKNINISNNSTALNSNINLTTTNNNNIILNSGTTGRVLTNKIGNNGGSNIEILNNSTTGTIDLVTVNNNNIILNTGAGNVLTNKIQSYTAGLSLSALPYQHVDINTTETGNINLTTVNGNINLTKNGTANGGINLTTNGTDGINLITNETNANIVLRHGPSTGKVLVNSISNNTTGSAGLDVSASGSGKTFVAGAVDGNVTLSAAGSSRILAISNTSTGNANININTSNTGSINVITNNNNITLNPGGALSSVDVSSKKIINLLTPTLANDATNKVYVDSLVGFSSGFKTVCRLKTTQTNLNAFATAGTGVSYNNVALGVGAFLTAGSVGVLVVDGVTVVVGDRILYGSDTDTTPSTRNFYGIYVATNVGSASAQWILTRATDADTIAELGLGTYTLITAGATEIGRGYAITTAPTTVGSTSILWTQMIAGSGAGAVNTGNISVGPVGNLNTITTTTGGITIEPFSNNNINVLSNNNGSSNNGGIITLQSRSGTSNGTSGEIKLESGGGGGIGNGGIINILSTARDDGNSSNGNSGQITIRSQSNGNATANNIVIESRCGNGLSNSSSGTGSGGTIDILSTAGNNGSSNGNGGNINLTSTGFGTGFRGDINLTGNIINMNMTRAVVIGTTHTVSSTLTNSFISGLSNTIGGTNGTRINIIGGNTNIISSNTSDLMILNSLSCVYNTSTGNYCTTISCNNSIISEGNYSLVACLSGSGVGIIGISAVNSGSVNNMVLGSSCSGVTSNRITGINIVSNSSIISCLNSNINSTAGAISNSSVIASSSSNLNGSSNSIILGGASNTISGGNNSIILGGNVNNINNSASGSNNSSLSCINSNIGPGTIYNTIISTTNSLIENTASLGINNKNCLIAACNGTNNIAIVNNSSSESVCNVILGSSSAGGGNNRINAVNTIHNSSIISCLNSNIDSTRGTISNSSIIACNLSNINRSSSSCILASNNSNIGINTANITVGFNNVILGCDAGAIANTSGDNVGSSNTIISSNIKLRNIGSRNTILSCGSANDIILSANSNNNIINVRQNLSSTILSNINDCIILGNNIQLPQPGSISNTFIFNGASSTLDSGSIYGIVDGGFIVRGTEVRFSTNGGFGNSLNTSSGAWTNTSDANMKNLLSIINGEEILEKLIDLPMYNWRYKTATATQNEISMGPTAQDWQAKFKLNQTMLGISTLEFDGVALSSIQGLNTKFERKITEVKQELSDTKQELSDTKQELSDTKQELSDTKQELSDTKQELSDTKQTLTDMILSLTERINKLEQK